MEHIDLSELLRDRSDIEDFLAAYGEEAPDQPRRARGRALDSRPLDPVQAIGVLFAFPRHFARMVSVHYGR